MVNTSRSQIEQLQNNAWFPFWAGNWSLLTGLIFGHYYTRILKKDLGVGFDHVVLVSRKGYTKCYFDVENQRVFGQTRAKQVAENARTLNAFVALVKKRADTVVDLVNDLEKKPITLENFERFIASLYGYIGLHMTPRAIVDFSDAKTVQQVMEPFTDVRVYTEKVYKRTEELMQQWAHEIASKTNLEEMFVLSETPDEIRRLLDRGVITEKTVLSNRFDECAAILTSDTTDLLVGEKVSEIENQLIAQNSDQLKGQVAYQGVVRGRARVVLEPTSTTAFDMGDILVTGMTRPQFLPLIAKAAAIVTDAGGILSHAAITARELKKPCVIGTLRATQILKDGDNIEVDAIEGIVRKI
jgi:phosphohistidine swiveling domain-containing protein